MTQTQGVFGDTVVRYVEFGDAYYPYVTVHLDGTDLRADSLFPLADTAAEELSEHVAEAKPELRRDGAVVVLSLKASGQYRDNYLPEGRREVLVEALSPTHTRKVKAAARIVRNKDTGKHTETRVTVTLEAGDPFKGIKARQYDGKGGILRARVDSDARSLVFTMSEPVASDEDGKITEVVETLVGKFGAMLVKPIDVKDDNPDAALNPANDYVAPASPDAAPVES